VDGDKVLLVSKTDNKTLDQYVFQYFNAPLYVDRSEAIDAAAASQDNAGAQKVLIAALHDKFYGLQIKAIKALDMSNDAIHNDALPVLASLAQTDVNTLVRAAAITALGSLKMSGNVDLFKQALTSQSYAIDGAALVAINNIDPIEGFKLAKTFEADNKGPLTAALLNVYATDGGDTEWTYVYQNFHNAGRRVKPNIVGQFAAMVGRINSPAYAQQGITELKNYGMASRLRGGDKKAITLLTNIKAQRIKLNDTASANAADDAITQLKGH